MLWWELRVGNVTLRDLCSSWGDDPKKAASAAAAPVAKTLLSASASGVDGREWVSGGDPTGATARCVLMSPPPLRGSSSVCLSLSLSLCPSVHLFVSPALPSLFRSLSKRNDRTRQGRTLSRPSSSCLSWVRLIPNSTAIFSSNL